MSSRSHGGSRYPSAYGHTPSYRSYHTLSSNSGLDTSLPSSSLSSSIRSDLARDRMFADDKFFDTSLDRTFDRYDMGLPSTTSGVSALDRYDVGFPSTSGTTSSSNKQVQSKSYTSKYSSVSDGGVPHVEYSTDSTYKSSATGPSGVPHSSYSHASSSYDSDRPYKNRVSSYSYNI